MVKIEAPICLATSVVSEVLPIAIQQPNPGVTSTDSELLPGCAVCVRLSNLWLTGEWQCPRCHGPNPDVAARLRIEYAKSNRSLT
jgi:hypothetical protein